MLKCGKEGGGGGVGVGCGDSDGSGRQICISQARIDARGASERAAVAPIELTAAKAEAADTGHGRLSISRIVPSFLSHLSIGTKSIGGSVGHGGHVEEMRLT